MKHLFNTAVGNGAGATGIGLRFVILYLLGCVVVTLLIDRWDMRFRPPMGHPMGAGGVVAGFLLVLLSWLWIVALLLVGSKFFGYLVKI